MPTWAIIWLSVLTLLALVSWSRDVTLSRAVVALSVRLANSLDQLPGRPRR